MLNGEKWNSIFFSLPFPVSFFHVFRVAGALCLGLLAEISYPKLLEMILVGQDGVCRRQKARTLKSWVLESWMLRFGEDLKWSSSISISDLLLMSYT